jgi:transcription elongation factor GreB
VFFGATVSLRDENGAQSEVTIVGVDESVPLEGRISWVAPMAKALLKARIGDVVKLVTPDGHHELEILDVSYPSS